MPRYDYQCKQCGHEAVCTHRMNENPEYLCLCSKPAKPMVRVIKTAPGFQLKGTGWYETDFK